MENNLINFKVSLENLSPIESQGLINILKSDLQNSNFEYGDTNILVFNRILTDQTNLNTIKTLVSNTISTYNTPVKFDKLDNLKEVLIPENTQYFKFLISNVSSQAEATSLINFMLNENRFFLIDIETETHYMTIVTDADFEYEVIQDILKSQGKTIFHSSEIEKYY